MKQGKLFGILVLSLLMVVSVATDAMGQGRGRRSRGFDKKCEKFVNCHDARDGRWDGRGPNRTNTFRRRRSRTWDRDGDFDSRRWRRRHRDRDRDFDHNRRWRRDR